MEGKVFAVTGAGSGIGRATAVRLAELGSKGIAISDVDQAGLEETQSICKIYSRPWTLVSLGSCQRLMVGRQQILSKDHHHKGRCQQSPAGRIVDQRYRLRVWQA